MFLLSSGLSILINSKNKIWPLYRWGSTASRLQSYYEDTVYFLPLSSFLRCYLNPLILGMITEKSLYVPWWLSSKTWPVRIWNPILCQWSDSEMLEYKGRYLRILSLNLKKLDRQVCNWNVILTKQKGSWFFIQVFNIFCFLPTI